jgi:hypothetical protein
MGNEDDLRTTGSSSPGDTTPSFGSTSLAQTYCMLWDDAPKPADLAFAEFLVGIVPRTTMTSM